MKTSFIKKTTLIVALSVTLTLIAHSQQPSFLENRQLDMSVFINQHGYHLNAAKYCVTTPGVTEFEVLNVETNSVVYTGKLEAGGKDFGDYMVGTFTAVKSSGTYYIRTGNRRSFPFKISKYIYDKPMQLNLHYFSKQRCGNSTTGYLTPCHLDEGRRDDNGEHQEICGGWHDASDLRKWVFATIYGMVGILKMAEIIQPGWDQGQVKDELLWGNRYFLSMQEPAGYVMYTVGKDHMAENRWTDNITHNEDDRNIVTKPDSDGTQYTFVAVQAMMSKFMRSDPEYSLQCLNAAVRCFNWCADNVKNYTTEVVGSALVAAIELYKTTGESKYIDFAYRMADKIVARQIPAQNGSPVNGFFKDNDDSETFDHHIARLDFAFAGLCQLVLTFPERQNAKYINAINHYCNNYLLVISNRNAFGLMPYEIYAKETPASRHLGGGYWYKYFMDPSLQWWVGINASITSKGIGLAMASRILKDPRLVAAAQRQLDWVFGANPFGISTMMGIGYEHPKFPMAYAAEAKNVFKPWAPYIPGAVLNGIGGDMDDMPDMLPGSWQTGEYWTPMIALTMWLMAELTLIN